MIILIVEDDYFIANDLAEIVGSHGHQVLGPVSLAADAIELAEATTPDLALIDMNLNEGLVGAALARHLLHRWGVRSIFITGHIKEALANQDTAIGVMEKPVSAETVLNSIALAADVLEGRAPPVHVPQGLRVFVPPSTR